MIRGHWRDFFVIHTRKKGSADQSLLDCLAGIVLPAGYRIWGYEDWDWFRKQGHQPSWQDELMSGSPVDFATAVNDRPRQHRNPDFDALSRILDMVRVVPFLCAGRNKVTKGMDSELDTLRVQAGQCKAHDLFPIRIWCSYGERDRVPYSIGERRWSAKLKIYSDNHIVDPCSAYHLAVVSTALMTLQRGSLASRQRHGDRCEGVFALPGSARTDFTRAKAVRDQADRYLDRNSRSYEPLCRHLDWLDAVMATLDPDLMDAEAEKYRSRDSWG